MENTTGWMNLAGMTPKKAAREILQSYIALFDVWSANEACRIPMYIVLDDGFDDAASYAPHLLLFRQKDVAIDPARRFDPTQFRSKPIATARISAVDQKTIVGLTPRTWGDHGDASGISAVVASFVFVTRMRKFPAGYEYLVPGNVAARWVSGRKFESERYTQRIDSTDYIECKSLVAD